MSFIIWSFVNSCPLLTMPFFDVRKEVSKQKHIKLQDDADAKTDDDELEFFFNE